MIRVIICGSRSWNKVDVIAKVVDRLPTDTVVIHGCASGADTIAGVCAESRELTVIKFPADWDKFGKSAGYKRNLQMLREGEPNLVIAFVNKDSESRGTKSMIDIAEASAIRVVKIEMSCPPICTACGNEALSDLACSHAFHNK